MPRHRSPSSWLLRIALAIVALPLAYALAAVVGGLVSVNRDWVEPAGGTSIYLASNGVHIDLLLPVVAEGVDWRRTVDPADAARPPAHPRFVAVGMGDREVYLNTPNWSDVSARTLVHALTGGSRVMHVEWVDDAAYATRQLRLTPDQYRRLAAAIAGGFRRGKDHRPVLLDHPGYRSDDRFYAGVGRASAINSCNQWIADMLRLAGVKAPAWSPLPEGLVHRYRPMTPHRT